MTAHAVRWTLALLVAMAVAACGPDEEGVLRQDDYTAIDLSELDEQPRGQSPQAAMAALVGEDIEFEELSHDGSGVALRAVQMAHDDSVAGIRTAAIVVEHPDGGWTVDWAGWQVKCWEGRGHDTWDTRPCM